MISLARETNIDAAVSKTASSHVRRSSHDARNLVRESLLKSLYKIKYIVSYFAALWITVAWPALKTKVLVPASIFFLALCAAVEKFIITKKHSFLCTAHQIAAYIARARTQRLTCIALLAGVSVFLFSTAFYSFGIEVIIDGESLGYVISQDDYMQSVSKVQSRVSRIMGAPHSVNPNVVFSFGIVERDNILEGERLESVLYSKIEGIEQLYALSVDGQIVGACSNLAGVESVIAELKRTEGANDTVEFLSKVEISYDAVNAQDLCTPEELLARARGTKVIETTHTVSKKQTAQSICNYYGMSRQTLRKLNPSVNTSSLSVGQEIVVTKTVPIVSMREFRRVTETISIPYETQEIKDSSLYVGKKSVKTNGVAGQKQVVADVTYIDGSEAERTVISETILSQPVTKVVLVGTKPLPKKAATGTFRRPTGRAVVSSDYGYRRGGFHTGIDFALAYGSPVYASDGGKVSFAGWKGGYGYLVIINHGNGKETYYAHNSKLLVSRGQKVGKGEQIAKIGSTGNSTGPHCHFEIRVNGRHVNPWRYID